YASLFVPWTWETPVIPSEAIPVIWWEGIDGTRILSGTHNELNLHQWPEEFNKLMRGGSDDAARRLGIVQWLELMPSPDWMCRSELMIPTVRELMDHPRLDVRVVTMSEMVESGRAAAEVRRYSMDDVFHGMSLGKNGDWLRRMSRHGEHTLLSAESLAAIAGLFGRPYPGWDVYPGWELEESWRELLTAQHHDIHASEGLCARIGLRSFERGLRVAEEVRDRTMTLLADRTAGPAGRLVVFNPLGWERPAAVTDPSSNRVHLTTVAPFGYRVIDGTGVAKARAIDVVEERDRIGLRRGDLAVFVDRASGHLTDLHNRWFDDGAVDADRPLGQVWMVTGGQVDRFIDVNVTVGGASAGPTINIHRTATNGAAVDVAVSLAADTDAVDVHFYTDFLPPPDGGMNAALQTTLATIDGDTTLIHDHPYGVSAIRAEGVYKKKYPTGDWMNSPQYFEDVTNPFSALHCVDIGDERRGLLCVHDGSQQMRRDGTAVHAILSMRDPWDGDYWVGEVDSRWRFYPHGPMSNAERWQVAQEFLRQPLVVSTTTTATGGGDLPAIFDGFCCHAPGVLLTALFRDGGELSDAALGNYAGARIPNPYVVRLVEFNGQPAEVDLTVPGSVAAAFRTNLLGEVEQRIEPTSDSDGGTRLTLAMRPHEITTLYLDLVNGRKAARYVDIDRPEWVLTQHVDSMAPHNVPSPESFPASSPRRREDDAGEDGG
ncbi:MAG: glycosyl hydrolase-related protein, partial [Acidimicrobiales bacterium]